MSSIWNTFGLLINLRSACSVLRQGHFVLWENKVYHRDINPSHLMYRFDKDGTIVGVLSDFDLASTQDTATGSDRTGTVPFMALALLADKALQGETRRIYAHDVESHIWALIWISLRYDEGKLRALKGSRPLDEWLTVNAIGCREKKAYFLYGNSYRSLEAGIGHERHWKLARKCMRAVRKANADDNSDDSEEPEQDDNERPVQDGGEHVGNDDNLEPVQIADEEPLHILGVDAAFQELLAGPARAYMRQLY